jgi:hypothetical protein
LVVGIQQTTTARSRGRLGLLLAGSTGDGEGQEGGYKDNTRDCQEEIGLKTFQFVVVSVGSGRWSAVVSEVVLVVLGRVLTFSQGTKLFAVVVDPRDGSLLRSHGYAISITVEAIMGVELPALVDEIIIIRTIVSNKVSILISRIVNTRSTEPEIVVDSIEIVKCVLLSGIPILIRLLMKGIVIRLILRPKVKISLFCKVIVGVGSTSVGSDAFAVWVETHLEASSFEGLDARVKLFAVFVVAYAEAIIVSHIFEACEGDNVFVFVNGPVLFG